MNAARIRIGRVKMRNGGAELRILHSNPIPSVLASIDSFRRNVAEYDHPPSAFVAIAYWESKEEPWRPSFVIGWDTEDLNLPLPRLMRNAAAQIQEFGTEERAHDRTMRALGYVRDDPDQSA